MKPDDSSKGGGPKKKKKKRALAGETPVAKPEAAAPEGDERQVSGLDARGFVAHPERDDEDEPQDPEEAMAEAAEEAQDEDRGAVADVPDSGTLDEGVAPHYDLGPGDKVKEPLAGEPWGLMGYFLTPAELVKACEALKKAGYRHFDAHTPFPVHGLERAMGLPPSKLPWIVLFMGATGLASAIGLAWYTQGFDYPVVVGGKPPFAFTAFVPIFFELTVLFSAFGAFFGLWGLCGLPRPFHPTMTHPAFPRATDDAFFVSVPVTDPKFDPTETRRLLEELGAREIAEVQA